MATLKCPCGKFLSLDGIGPYEWALISNNNIDKIADGLIGREFDEEKFYDDLGDYKLLVYRCDNCQRLYVWDMYKGVDSLLQYNIEYITPFGADEGFPGPVGMAEDEQAENK